MSFNVNIPGVWPDVVVFLPLVVYALAFLGTLGDQCKRIPQRRHEPLNRRMNANLTLAGLTFTVIGLVATLFQEHLTSVLDSLYCFAVAMTMFLLSYALLQLKLRKAFDTISNAATSTGLWSLIAGLVSLSQDNGALEKTVWLFKLLLFAFGLYILFDAYLNFRNPTGEASGE